MQSPCEIEAPTSKEKSTKLAHLQGWLQREEHALKRQSSEQARGQRAVVRVLSIILPPNLLSGFQASAA